MPWYRTEDGQGVYHACIRGRRGSPLACRADAEPSDNPAHGVQCGRLGNRKLCDGPGCDLPLCDRHTTPHPTKPDTDYCPKHKHLAEVA